MKILKRDVIVFTLAASSTKIESFRLRLLCKQGGNLCRVTFSGDFGWQRREIIDVTSHSCCFNSRDCYVTLLMTIVKFNVGLNGKWNEWDSLLKLLMTILQQKKKFKISDEGNHQSCDLSPASNRHKLIWWENSENYRLKLVMWLSDTSMNKWGVEVASDSILLFRKENLKLGRKNR